MPPTDACEPRHALLTGETAAAVCGDVLCFLRDAWGSFMECREIVKECHLVLGYFVCGWMLMYSSDGRS